MGGIGDKGVLFEVKQQLLKLSFRVTVLTAALLVSTAALAQVPTKHLELGEQLTYEAEFSRLLLKNIDVADFHFSASKVPLTNPTETSAPEATKNGHALQFTGEIKSKGFFSRLFNLNFLERVTSTVEPGSFVIRHTKKFDQQGKRVRTSETIYDRNTGKLVWTEHDPKDPSKEPQIASAEFNADVQDVLSAIYFLRTQPLAVGKTFNVSISDSGRVYQVPVRVTEKKRMKTVLGRVETLKVDVELFGKQRLVESDGEFFIWFTADRLHVPVKGRIKTQYGTFDITLKKAVPSRPRAA